MLPLAHGVGVRADLPLPPSYALAGAGAAVLVSFAAVRLLWPTSRLRGDAAGRPLPLRLQRALDSAPLRRALQALVLTAAAVVLLAAVVGPQDPAGNLAPWALYVTFWVGLVPASLLLGPVWRVVNPLRALHRWLAPVVGGGGRDAGRLEALGHWPAAAGLGVFTWLELCYPERAEPATVAGFLIGYAAVQLAAALRFGPGWFARGDAFEVYSSLLGRLAVLGRRADGRLVVRNPLDGLDGLAASPGLAAVVVVLIGGTAFDGVTRTRWWEQGPGAQGEEVVPQTAGLALTVLAVGALYGGATRLGALLEGFEPGRRAPGLFAHALVPIAAGYAIAHYASLLLLDGQRTWILASDPLGRGWDLLGTAGATVDYSVVSPEATRVVQVGAIVGGHVVGVLLAHDRSVRLATGRRGTAAQLPLLVAMIALTVGGLGLLLGA